MSGASDSGLWDLAKFFTRSRPARLGMAAAFISLFVVTVLLISIQSTRQSASQIADQMSGRFDAVLQSESLVDIQGDGSSDASLVDSMRTGGATDVAISYRSFDLRARGTIEPFFYQEFSAEGYPYASSQTLISGRPADDADEVVVSTALSDELGLSAGDLLVVEPGGETLQVVGVLEDDLARDARSIYAGSGTWRSLAPAWSAAEFVPSATRDLYWSGGEVADVLASIAPHLASDATALAALTSVRADLVNRGPVFGPEELLVGLLGPFVVTFGAGVYLAVFSRRISDTLHILGVSARLSQIAVVLAGLTVSVIGSVLGFLGGALASLTVVLPVLDRQSDHALASANAAILLAGLSIPIAIVGLLSPLAIRRDERRRVSDPRPPTLLLLALAVLVSTGGVFVVQQSSSFDARVVGALVIGLGVVIASPLLLPVLLRGDGQGGAIDLGRRRLRSQRGPAAATMIVLAALVLAGATVNTLLVSSLDTLNSSTESDTPPSQIEVATASPGVQVKGVADALGAELGLADPVVTWIAEGSTSEMNGVTILVLDRDSLERLVMRPLTDDEWALLERGGTLLTKSLRAAEVVYQRLDGTQISLESEPVSGIDPAFRSKGGFMLKSAAENVGIVPGHESYVFTDVSQGATESLPAAVDSLALDPAWVASHETPDRLVAPLSTVLTAIAVAVLSSLAVFAYSAGVVRRSRPQLAALRSIGLDRTWLTLAVGTQILLVVTIASLVGALAGVFGAVAMLRIAVIDVQLSVPWLFFGVLLGCLLFTSVLAAVTSSKKITTFERLEEQDQLPAK